MSVYTTLSPDDCHWIVPAEKPLEGTNDNADVPLIHKLEGFPLIVAEAACTVITAVAVLAQFEVELFPVTVYVAFPDIVRFK